MNFTRLLRLAGTLLCTGALLFNVIETAWFGFHLTPSCPQEKLLDDYTEVLFLYGLLVLAVAWLRSKSEVKE